MPQRQPTPTASLQALSALEKLREAVTKVNVKQTIATPEKKLASKTASFFQRQGTLIYNALVNHWQVSEADQADFLDKLFDNATSDENDRYAELAQSAIEGTFGVAIGKTLKGFKLDIAFDIKSPKAQQYLKNYGADLVKEVNQVTKDRIKAIINDGVDNGLSYAKIARQIKAEFVDYAKLPKYGPKHIRSRAQLIAITEIGNAYQAAQLATIKEAMSTGLEFEKYWSNTGDSRVSDGCIENTAAGWIDIDASFPSGDDRPLRFPGCRCALLMRRKRS